MGSSLRGEGLFRAHDALTALLEDPQLLDRARSRFDHTPPPYRSQPSGTTTRSSPSPDLRTDEERRRHEKYRERYAELTTERDETHAQSQFFAQWREEEKRISEEKLIHKDACYRIDTYQIAKENVKKLWVEQGIWDEEWDDNCIWSIGLWKHQKPLDGAQDEAATISSSGRKAGPKKKKIQPSDEEKARAARDREASRPFHQFIFQVSKRREQIEAQSLLLVDQAAPTNPHDINTRAYDDVKNIWIKRKIWNMKWGILPGMTWFSDQPLDEYRERELGPNNKLEPPSHESNNFKMREAPSTQYRGIFEVSAESIQKPSTAPDLFQPPAELTQQASDVSNVSELGSPQQTDILGSVEWEKRMQWMEQVEARNNNNNRASSTPSPQQPPKMIRGSGRGRGRPRHRGQPAQESEQPPVLPRRSKRLREADALQQAPVRASKRQRMKRS